MKRLGDTQVIKIKIKSL